MSDDLKKELKQGGSKIDELAAQKRTGYTSDDERAGDFLEGYRRGKNASNPNNTDGAGDTAKKVRGEYEGKNKEEREAYKKGYAEGSSKR